MRRRTKTCSAVLWLLGAASAVFAQDNFSLCDVNHDHAVNVLDVQAMANQALGKLSPGNDLLPDGVVNVADVQTELNVILYGCPFYSPTPRFVITAVSLLNRNWNPSNIPSAGDLSVHAAQTRSVSVMNQAWISADIPSPGNITSNAVNSRSASVMNQAWITADIPSAGNVTSNAVDGKAVSVMNQAWISADIPSPGNVNDVAGMLVSLNNTNGGRSVPGPSGVTTRVIAGGSSTTPVDLASVSDGDALLAGQTVRFRVFPPEEAIAGSDFLMDGAALRVHAPFEVLVTAPASGSGFDLQAVIYQRGGRIWRTPPKHLMVLADAGQTVAGRAVSGDRSMAAGAIGVRTNGLRAEYFRAERGLASWAELDRPADKRGYVTAVNQPDSTALGADRFGTEFTTSYATRFRGEILVSLDGLHQFFVDSPLGSRLMVDGNALIDNPPAAFAPEAQAEMELTAGWHTIEIDSFQSASHAGLQLSWRQPNTGREVVRPEALATESGPLAVTDSNGLFRVASFPLVLTPLAWHSLPADSRIHVTLDGVFSEERPVQQ